jgi:hypothetical protein
MRKRFRHLFQKDRRSAIDSLAYALLPEHPPQDPKICPPRVDFGIKDKLQEMVWGEALYISSRQPVVDLSLPRGRSNRSGNSSTGRLPAQ